jgi:PPOX class probable F420-dependent enzyme
MMLRKAPPGQEGQASASLNLVDVLGTAIGIGVGGAAVAAAASSHLPLGIAAAFAAAAAVALLALTLTRRLPGGAGSSPPGEPPGEATEHRRDGGCSWCMIQDGFAEFLAGQRQGVLVTLRPNGRPQLSNVNYAWYPEEQTIKVSTTDDRAKTANLRRDPRASFHVTSGDFWSYVVVDGQAELSAVARDTGDAAVAELIDLYRAVQGEHPDWDDYRAAMVRDRRLVVRLRAEHAYGFTRR